MEVTELMVGDWVYQDVPEQPYFQIEDYYDISDADDFEPIPITPEILKRNGFEKQTHNCSDYYEYSCDKNGDFIVLRQYPCGYFEIHITDNECYRSVRTPIHYVHEMQHALRLCKIDKEIKLL